MLPKAHDAETMSLRDHVSTPASMLPGPGIRPLRSPWGKVAGPVALYGTTVGWRVWGVRGQNRVAEDATNPSILLCLGSRHGWTVSDRVGSGWE